LSETTTENQICSPEKNFDDNTLLIFMGVSAKDLIDRITNLMNKLNIDKDSVKIK